jgi:hydrogenase expression/formation protein HypE
MRHAAHEASVQLVTGDTKVVDKGKGDGIFINTAGVGVIEHNLSISPATVRQGDAILLSGDLGRHGIAIMAQREGLAFETTIESDCAPLAEPVMKLIGAGIEIHCLRDLTRGGLASALVEIAEAAGQRFEIDENAIPVREDVRGACEILGLDPLYLANEGRFVAFVPEADLHHALRLLNPHRLSHGFSVIGKVTSDSSPVVVMKSRIGASRIVDMVSGEQLPRIC